MTYPIDPKLNHDCNKIHIANYELKEVILPPVKGQKARTAIAIRIYGRNFRFVADPLIAYVGDVQVRYLRIAPNERSIEGVLLKDPAKGSFVDVVLGDDHARHPTPIDLKKIIRI